jgi:hypothetical protein
MAITCTENGERCDIREENYMKHTRSKVQRGLVTRRIVYANRKRPRDRNQELKVDIRNGTVLDMDYAAALVAVRTPLLLADVKIIKIEAD